MGKQFYDKICEFVYIDHCILGDQPFRLGGWMINTFSPDYLGQICGSFSINETLLKFQVGHKNPECKAYFHYIQWLG